MQRNGSGRIGTPTQMPDGSGPRLWLLEGNVLKLHAVYQTGGSVLQIKLRKINSNLSCLVAGVSAKEFGAGPNTDKGSGGVTVRRCLRGRRRRPAMYRGERQTFGRERTRSRGSALRKMALVDGSSPS
jgi:hypothetical protein